MYQPKCTSFVGGIHRSAIVQQLLIYLNTSAIGLCVRKCSDSLRVFASVHLFLNNNSSDVSSSSKLNSTISSYLKARVKAALYVTLSLFEVLVLVSVAFVVVINKIHEKNKNNNKLTSIVCVCEALYADESGLTIVPNINISTHLTET